MTNRISGVRPPTVVTVGWSCTMARKFSSEELYAVRNNIPVRFVIEEVLELPWKMMGKTYRFLCPQCNEFQPTINRSTNLSRCFLCKDNFNTIELVMLARKTSFVEAVQLLQWHLAHLDNSMQPRHGRKPPERSCSRDTSSGERLSFAQAQILRLVTEHRNLSLSDSTNENRD